MQTRPDNWEALFSGPHKTEYKFLIDGVEYSGSDLQGTPCLTKPLMDQPTFGRCCSGTLTLSVRKKSGVEIPKAATVVARCRLSSKDGATVTDWVEQGHFCVSKRQGRDIISLTCRDLMGKSGDPYAPRATFEEWPVPMTDVVEEIAAIMGVTVDPRTVINTGPEYVVTRPSDDTLMSEVLAGIAAAHFGSWIMNEKGQLRLVTVSMWGAAPIRQEIGRAYGKYTPISTAQRVSRLTLIDSADNVFTVGDDTGRELVSQCEYATQSMCDSLLDGAEIVGRTLTGLPGSVRARTYNTKTGKVSGRDFVFPFKQFPAVSFVPYTLTGAYIDPCLELGDTVAIDCRGTRVELVLASMTIRCNMSYNADVSFEVEQDDEDEYPYTDLQTLQASRVVSTHKSYYGTKISRESGFVSDRIVDGEVVARLTANADTFAMQQLVDGDWEDRIYFDPVKKKYVLTGEVEVNGVLTVADLENKQEKTFINGANIVTGTLTANTITSGALKSKDGTLVLDLDNNKLTIGGDDILDAIAKVDNQLSISADSQLFVREDGMEDYTPTKITLKAETRGALKSFQWSKDGSAIVGATSDTLNIIPTDFAGNSATYSVTAVDEYGNPYSAFLTVAKLTGGDDGYTVILSRQYVMVNVDVERKPTVAESVSCNVQVYKGLTPLSATNSTPGENQYRVEVTNTAAGITVTQSTPGALVISVSKTTAIADTSVLQLEMTTGDGVVLRGNIVIQANMNSVVAAHESSIKTLEDEIVLKVSETQYHTQMPTYSSTDPSVGWSAEDKAANVGFLWYDTSAKALKSWSGSKWVSASDDTWASHAEASVSVTATKIGWLVKSGTSASNFTMTDRAMMLATSSLSIATTDLPSANVRVENIPGSTYGFALSDGIYTSQNHNISSSEAHCRIRFYAYKAMRVVFKCFNSGENNFDFGYIGKIDTALDVNIIDGRGTEDTSEKIFKSFKGNNTTGFVDVPMDVPEGEHFFEVKYHKDTSADQEPDCFKFYPFAVQEAAGSTLSIKSGETVLSSADIVLKGIVTFSDLASSGATVINGDNITTGTLTGVTIRSENKIETVSLGDVYALTTMHDADIHFETELRDPTTGQVIQNQPWTRAIGDLKVADDDIWTGGSVLWATNCLSLESDASAAVRVYSPYAVLIKSGGTIELNGAIRISTPGGHGTAGQYLRSGGDGSVYWG